MNTNEIYINSVLQTYQNNDAIANRVQRLYQHSAPIIVCEGLLFISGGILILLRPIWVMTALTAIVGIGLFLFGMYRTIIGFFSSRSIFGGIFDVFFGLLNIVLGVLFCIYPVGSLVGLFYIFCILFLFKGLRMVIFSINMMRAKFGHYRFNFIISLFLTSIAILLIKYPSTVTVVIAYYLSIMMIFYGVTDIYMYSEYAKLRRYYV